MGYAGRVLNLMFDDMDNGRSNGTKRDLKALRNLLNKARHGSVKFIVPFNGRPRADQPITTSDLRPPFPMTLMEFDVGETGAAAMIIAMDRGDSVYLFCAVRFESFRDDADWFIAPALAYIEYSDKPALDDDALWHSKPFLNDRIDDIIAAHDGDVFKAAEFVLSGTMKFIRVYVSTCQTLKYRHTETIDVEPDAKENRIRRIKRQTPLFTYKTLVIGEPKPKVKGHKGGTHASPRSHLRRGHYRTSKNGIRYWVSAAFVNGAPGFVHKDYKLEGITNQ
jgi:hypothetical protein